MSLYFVIPAHGRLELAAICFLQLAGICETLGDASAVVVADDENLDTASELGFDTLERPNSSGLGRRFNDGFEWAARQGADHVVPAGSDDWLEAGLFAERPARSIVCFRSCSIVSEDGSLLARLRIPYAGGIGIRVLPVALLRKTRFRPADDARMRAIDASILRSLNGAKIEYRETDPLAIVDFKTAGGNLNTFDGCEAYVESTSDTPFDELAAMYPAELVYMMAAHYAHATVAA